MAFVSWDQTISDLKDAYADWVSGAPMTKEYTIGGRSMSFSTAQEFSDHLAFCRAQKNAESSGDRTQMVSYGRYRRFR